MTMLQGTGSSPWGGNAVVRTDGAQFPATLVTPRSGNGGVTVGKVIHSCWLVYNRISGGLGGAINGSHVINLPGTQGWNGITELGYGALAFQKGETNVTAYASGPDQYTSLSAACQGVLFVRNVLPTIEPFTDNGDKGLGGLNQMTNPTTQWAGAPAPTTGERVKKITLTNVNPYSHMLVNVSLASQSNPGQSTYVWNFRTSAWDFNNTRGHYANSAWTLIHLIGVSTDYIGPNREMYLKEYDVDGNGGGPIAPAAFGTPVVLFGHINPLD